MLATAAFFILATLAAASPVPSTEPRAGVTTMHEGKPRMSFAERAEANGVTIPEQVQADRSYVWGKYQHNVAMVKVSHPVESPRRH